MSLFDRLFRRSQLTCTEVALVMQSFLDDELEPAEVPKVLRHLEMCRDCGLEADLYRRIKTSLLVHQFTPSPDSTAQMRAFAEELAAGDPPAPHPAGH